MEHFRGVITYDFLNEGSKSEGYYAHLVDNNIDTPTTYKLCRKDVYSVNDNYFEEFQNREVEVEGVKLMNNWIEVYAVTIVEENTK